MILSQHYILWLGSFPKLTVDQANDFDSSNSFASRVTVDPIVAWEWDVDTDDLPAAITTRGRVSADRMLGIIGPTRTTVEAETKAHAMRHYHTVKGTSS